VLAAAKTNPYLKITVSILCFAIAALLFIYFLEQLPVEGTTLGIDWLGLWSQFQGGTIRYMITDGLRNPPWSVLPLIPLGLISARASWGVLSLLTITVFVVSVPRTERKPLYWLSVALLIISYPSLRHLVDGNFEALVTGGILLTLYGYARRQPYYLAVGILLATAKPQASILFMAVLGLYVLQTWPPHLWIKTTLAVLAVVIPTMLWRGGDWIKALQGTYQSGSIIDISLTTTLTRTTFFPSAIIIALWLLFIAATLFIAWKSDRTLPREKAAMLTAASLLIAPYAAGNSVLTVMALGVIPLFQAWPLLGGLLIALIDFPFFWNIDLLYNYSSYYFTAIMLLCWGIMGWRTLKRKAVDNPELAQLENPGRSLDAGSL
jgi:hypothetical protein